MALMPRRRPSTRGPQDGRAPELVDDSYRTGARGQPMPGPKPPRPMMRGPQDGSDGMVPEIQRPTPRPPGSVSPQVGQRPTPALPSRAPKPVAQDREGRPIQGVSGRLHGLLQSDSPYLDRARTRARQLANRRGLMASSIAAGAGEAAAIDAALPIAQADASIAAGERVLRSNEYQQYRAIRSQELMQQRGLDHASAENALNRELQEMLQQREHRVQQLMQTERIGHDAAQRQADRELSQTLQTGSQAFRTQEAALDRRAAELAQQRGIDAQTAQAEAQREFSAAQAELDRRAAELAQERGISAADARDAANREAAGRIAVSTAVGNANNRYASEIATIDNNPNIGAEDRERMKLAARGRFNDAMSLIEQTHNVDLDWSVA